MYRRIGTCPRCGSPIYGDFPGYDEPTTTLKFDGLPRNVRHTCVCRFQFGGPTINKLGDIGTYTTNAHFADLPNVSCSNLTLGPWRFDGATQTWGSTVHMDVHTALRVAT